jgi:hypothetical protein
MALELKSHIKVRLAVSKFAIISNVRDPDPDSIGPLDPDPVSQSGSAFGLRRAK